MISLSSSLRISHHTITLFPVRFHWTREVPDNFALHVIFGTLSYVYHTFRMINPALYMRFQR